MSAGAVGLLFLGLLACGKDTPIQGFDLSDPNTRGEVDSTSINDIDFELTYTDTLIPAGSFSGTLLVGSFNNVETRSLLRFTAIPDTVEVRRATLILRSSNVIADEAKTSFVGSVHNVLDDWEVATVTDENFHYNFDANPIATTELLSVTEVFDENDSLIVERVRFEFDAAGVELVNGWADTLDTVPNNGILIDFSNSNFIKGFFTRFSSLNPPVLELEVMSGATLDTISVAVSQNAYLARQLTQPVPGPLYVDHLFGNHSIVKFDLSTIPRESTINRAQMELAVDGANTFIAEAQFPLQILRLLRPFTEPDSLLVDGDFEVTATFEANTSSLTITSEQSRTVFRRIVQDWVTGQVENHGLLIRSLTPGLSTSRLAFIGAQTDPSKAPKIVLDFSVAPTIRNSN